MVDQKKVTYIIPNLFTALNMACGFAAILQAHAGQFYIASILLILGSIFDLVDGRVARLLDASSDFGEQFDSLSDLISFGISPAILVYFRFYEGYGRYGIILGMLFLICGALRLARFNVNIEKVSSKFFQGLPIPAAAMSQIGLVLLSLEFTDLSTYGYIFAPFTILSAYLMVSNIPFYSFKDSKYMQDHKAQGVLIVIVVLLSILLHEEISILALCYVYIFSNLFYYLFNRRRLKNVFNS